MARLGRDRRLRLRLTDAKASAPVCTAVYPHPMAKGNSARAGLLALLTIVAAVIVGVLMALNGEVFLGVVAAMVGLRSPCSSG